MRKTHRYKWGDLANLLVLLEGLTGSDHRLYVIGGRLAVNVRKARLLGPVLARLRTHRERRRGKRGRKREREPERENEKERARARARARARE